MLVEPKSAEELYYYTDRDIDSGSVRVWVFKLKCPKCNNYVQKPRDKKGKPMKKADYYECIKCGFRMDSKEYESKLIANIQYKCPYCDFNGEKQIPFVRKNVYFKEFDELRGKEKKNKVLALVFKCEKCGKEIYVTQKMKDIK